MRHITVSQLEWALQFHRMFGKTYIGRFTDIKDPLDEENEQKEAENIVEEDNDETLEDEEFGLCDIVH